MSLCYTEANPMTLFAALPSNTAAPALQIPVSTAQQGRTTSWLKVTECPSSCPARCSFCQWAVDNLAGRVAFTCHCRLDKTIAAILANVARRAQWKLNCFPQKRLCDDQLPNRDLFYGSVRGQKGRRAFAWMYSSLGKCGCDFVLRFYS